MAHVNQAGHGGATTSLLNDDSTPMKTKSHVISIRNTKNDQRAGRSMFTDAKLTWTRGKDRSKTSTIVILPMHHFKYSDFFYNLFSFQTH